MNTGSLTAFLLREALGRVRQSDRVHASRSKRSIYSDLIDLSDDMCSQRLKLNGSFSYVQGR